MSSYDVAQICKNGHLINESYISYPQHNQKYCSLCGAETIIACEFCGEKIRGYYSSDVLILSSDPTPVPTYCPICGKPYPWTKSALESAALLITEEEEFSEQMRDSLIDSLPDIITETPKTNLAVVRIKKGLLCAGKFTAEAIRQFVIDFGCELAKKSIGL